MSLVARQQHAGSRHMHMPASILLSQQQNICVEGQGGGKQGSFFQSSPDPRVLPCLNLICSLSSFSALTKFKMCNICLQFITHNCRSFVKLYITQVTWQLIRAHPPPSPLLLCMAGPILWNIKMIPCSEGSPVEQKLNVHFYRNLNSSLMCEVMLRITIGSKAITYELFIHIQDIRKKRGGSLLLLIEL